MERGGGEKEEEGGGGGEAALGAASVEGEGEGDKSIASQYTPSQFQGWIISRPFVFQDLNESYPVLAPIRRPGRRERGGDTIVIHGSQSSHGLQVKSENGAEIEEDESEEEDDIRNKKINGANKEDEKRESERIADTPVPPRFTKALIWT